MKKILLVLLVLVGAAYVFRADLAQLIMQRGLDRNMSGNAFSELDDGLLVTLCGAGGPLADPVRSGPCIAIWAGGQFYLIDAGSGSARNLGRLRLPAGGIEAVLLTHFHSDHIDGLGAVALNRWVQAAHTEPLPVYGPEGVASVVNGFNQAYSLDSRYRQAHHGDEVAPLSGSGMRAVEFALPAQGELSTVISAGALFIQALAVPHEPVDPAVGYLVRYKDRSVLISGDTAASENLRHFAKGVDLLLHEALSTELVALVGEAAARNGNSIMASIAGDIPDYHATPVQAAEIARDAGVKHLLYYHVVPPLPVPGAEALWLRGVDAVFEAHTLGRDGSSFFLPAGSDEVRRMD